MLYYGNKLSKALLEIFPNIGLDVTKFHVYRLGTLLNKTKQKQTKKQKQKQTTKTKTKKNTNTNTNTNSYKSSYVA